MTIPRLPRRDRGRVARLALAAAERARAPPTDLAPRGRRSRPRSGAASPLAAGRFRVGGDALLRVAHGPGPPVLPGPDAGASRRRRRPSRAPGRPARSARRGRPPARSAPSSTSTRDRALFLAVDRCAVYCRHCTRRRHHPRRGGRASTGPRSAEAVAYVRAHPEVRDVIVSGGDPLVLSDERLERAPRRAAAPSPTSRSSASPPARRWSARCASTDALAATAPPPRPALRRHPLQPPQGVHRRGPRGLRARSSTTASRSRTRPCCCAA